VVLRITHVQPALVPPRVQTIGDEWDASSGAYTLDGELLEMGDSKSLEVGFEYRSIAGEDVHSRSAPWVALPPQTLTHPGRFSASLTGLPASGRYEFRAVVRHPLLSLYGAEKIVRRTH
jgi:alpha-L-fucosidase